MSASSKRFRVALSFSGEKRDYVAKVAAMLAARLGEAAVLYDKYHEAEFARRDLGLYLADLYHDESDLVIVILSREYETKEWCGLEWDAIFDLLKKRRNEEIMLCRFDHAAKRGLYSTAGFVELDGKTVDEATACILERLALNEGKPRDYYLSYDGQEGEHGQREDVTEIRLDSGTRVSLVRALAACPSTYTRYNRGLLIDGLKSRIGDLFVRSNDQFDDLFTLILTAERHRGAVIEIIQAVLAMEGESLQGQELNRFCDHLLSTPNAD